MSQIEIIWDYLSFINFDESKKKLTDDIVIKESRDNFFDVHLYTVPFYNDDKTINKYRTYIYFRISIHHKITSSNYDIKFDEIYNKGLFRVDDMTEDELFPIIIPIIREEKLKSIGIKE